MTTKQPSSHSHLRTVDSLLTPATLVTFFRLFVILLSAVVFHPNYPTLFVLCALLSIILDYVDGLLARRLNCSTALGSLLDVSVDIFSRAILLVLSSRPMLACSLCSIEWLTFICAQSDRHWKHTPHCCPRFVRAVMHNGLRSPVGAVAVTGLFGLPLWSYIDMVVGGPLWVWSLLVAARCIAGAAELWFIGNYIQSNRYEPS
eukprot:GHVS01079531.1.p1 GENE.GHVS01079531.1~~GHVS01079531.1.p1  ORF type:complete len:203 (+),score=25.56 GHVS01079531.1:239-847(+)